MSEKNIQNPANLLANFKFKAAQLEQLNQLLRSQLESALALHCSVANLRDNILIIEVDSAAWATRLRYIIPELLQKLRTQKEFYRLQEVQWYIQPTEAQSTQSHAKKLSISSESVELIADTAKHISNKNLQTALKKLASRK